MCRKRFHVADGGTPVTTHPVPRIRRKFPEIVFGQVKTGRPGPVRPDGLPCTPPQTDNQPHAGRGAGARQPGRAGSPSAVAALHQRRLSRPPSHRHPAGNPGRLRTSQHTTTPTTTTPTTTAPRDSTDGHQHHPQEHPQDHLQDDRQCTRSSSLSSTSTSEWKPPRQRSADSDDRVVSGIDPLHDLRHELR